MTYVIGYLLRNLSINMDIDLTVVKRVIMAIMKGTVTVVDRGGGGGMDARRIFSDPTLISR